MADEIERKFLVKDIPPNLEDYASHEISQGYLADDDDLEIRLRRKDDNHYETVKSGHGLRRREAEIEIGKKDFHTLWPFTEGKRVEKTRYEIPYGDYVIELDVYSGALAGLVTAEVEFKTEDGSAAFVPPGWLGRDVTEDKRYKNKHLAIHGKPVEL